MRYHGRALALLLGAWLQPATASAERAEPPRPRASGTGTENEPALATGVERQIDLASVVTSAAKGMTTVQEAPSIITILTADEIRSRGFYSINQVLATVPGWLDSTAVGNQVQIPLVRGVEQAVLLLHDGISMFEPWGNVPHLNRAQPLENLKRVEIVTGPGGVLWGANSFLGIVNLITKDAEDVGGWEAHAGYGDGQGNRQDVRSYVLFGRSLFSGKLKIFQHLSYENYLGPVYSLPQFIASTPAPQPSGPAFYGPVNGAPPERSWLLYLDGRYSWGPLSFVYALPFGAIHPQLTFANAVVPNDRFDIYDRYGVLEYQGQLPGKLRLDVKGYYIQFVRSFSIELFPPSYFFPPPAAASGGGPGGLHFDLTHHLVQRFGTTLDAEARLLRGLKLLFGGEMFRESISGSTTSFQVDKTSKLPLYCPVDRSRSDGLVPGCPRQFVNDADRVVGALYLDAQWRPLRNLILDGGVRLQRGFGGRPYDLTPLYSGALVWNFLPDYHAKINYATGFRPPVFQNTEAAPGGLEYGGSPTLKTESSQSLQGELNARLLRNLRGVRALDLRLDYSYTVLSNLITIQAGSYSNAGKQAIHSVESYAKLYLTGDHLVTASYTFLFAVSTDKGVLRSRPHHWLSLGAVFKLLPHRLDANLNLLVTSSYEDANRYPSRPAAVPGVPEAGIPAATSRANPSDLTFDRLTPVALLQIGARLHLDADHVVLGAQFYNVLNQHYYYPDVFYDLTPTIELTPTPAPAFHFLASVTYVP